MCTHCKFTGLIIYKKIFFIYFFFTRNMVMQEAKLQLIYSHYGHVLDFTLLWGKCLTNVEFNIRKMVMSTIASAVKKKTAVTILYTYMWCLVRTMRKNRNEWQVFTVFQDVKFKKSTTEEIISYRGGWKKKAFSSNGVLKVCTTQTAPANKRFVNTIMADCNLNRMLLKRTWSIHVDRKEFRIVYTAL